MNALWLPSSTIDSEKSTVTGITVCITRGPEITGVTTLLQLLPQRVMSCPVPPSVCYIYFLYWAFPTRIEGYSWILPFIVLCIYAAQNTLISLLWIQNQWAWECPG